MFKPRKSPKPKSEKNPKSQDTQQESSSHEEQSNEREIDTPEINKEDLNIDEPLITEDTEDIITEIVIEEETSLPELELKDNESKSQIPEIDIPTDLSDDSEVFSTGNTKNINYSYEYDPERSYVFIFGPSTVGKTVIIGSILKYLKSYRSKEFGDTLKNINNKNVIHEKEGNILWRDLTKANIDNKFPSGTGTIDSTTNFRNNPAPRHLNLHYLPAKNIPDFKFCFLDMAGEDLSKLDYEASKPLPKSIETYVEKVPKQNMCFIFVIDPKCTTASKSEQIVLFDAFIETLDSNEHTSTPLLILVSKWDTIKDQYKDVEEYLETEFEDVWGAANQQHRNISIAEFSIGRVNIEENKPLSYDPSYPERVFNWLYKTQIGTSLIEEEDKEKPKGWLTRLFKGFKRS